MAYGRLHEQAAGNGKLLALSDAAWRLWGSGLIYCQINLTDGFIPEHAIRTFGVRGNVIRAARELCKTQIPDKAPLWESVTGGYQVHDYLDWNDSREQIEQKRELARHRFVFFRDSQLRRRLQKRDQNRCRYCGKVVNWKDRRGRLGATYDHVDPYGPATDENLVVACRSCNSRKGGRTPTAAGMVLLPEPGSRSEPRSDLDPDLSKPRKKPRSQQATTYNDNSTESPNGDSDNARARTDDDVLADRAGRFLERYARWHADFRAGAAYHGRPAVDFQVALELVATYTDSDLERMALFWLTVDDPADDFLDRGRTVTKFRARASWCDERTRVSSTVSTPTTRELFRELHRSVGRDGRVWLEGAAIHIGEDLVTIRTPHVEKLRRYQRPFEAVIDELAPGRQLQIAARELEEMR